jgi:hypothetical protein
MNRPPSTLKERLRWVDTTYQVLTHLSDLRKSKKRLVSSLDTVVRLTNLAPDERSQFMAAQTLILRRPEKLDEVILLKQKNAMSLSIRFLDFVCALCLRFSGHCFWASERIPRYSFWYRLTSSQLATRPRTRMMRTSHARF